MRPLFPAGTGPVQAASRWVVGSELILDAYSPLSLLMVGISPASLVPLLRGVMARRGEAPVRSWEWSVRQQPGACRMRHEDGSLSDSSIRVSAFCSGTRTVAMIYCDHRHARARCQPGRRIACRTVRSRRVTGPSRWRTPSESAQRDRTRASAPPPLASRRRSARSRPPGCTRRRDTDGQRRPS